MTSPYRRLFIFLGLIIAVIGVVFVVQRLQNDDTSKYTARQACNILTPSVAQALGGKDLVQQKLKSTSDATTQTTFCVYRSKETSLSLVVRSAKNKQGEQLNTAAFAKPAVAGQKLRGYGDDALWIPTLAQLNILKHGNWYILSNGSTTASSRTLTDAKKLADKIINQL